MKNYCSFLSLLFLIPITLFSQDFNISKIQSGTEITNQSMVYSLPRTSLKVNLEVTKFITKKGPYAEFAAKYLGLTNVVKSDSDVWQITGLECVPLNEPDPLQYYGITYKTLPVNLQSIYSLHNHGIILNIPQAITTSGIFESNLQGTITMDPQYTEDVITERMDTFYKTIMNDTAFVKIPVFKKQIHAKTLEELAKETAHELIKTRKRRIKLIRGDYEFHPDAATLRLMLDEMQKQEELFLQLFRGITIEQKFIYQFNILPTESLSNAEIGYFNKENGFSKVQFVGSDVCTVHFIKNEPFVTTKSSVDKDFPKNNILYRVPASIAVTFTLGEKEISRLRVPFYQFGSIQTMDLKLK